MNTPHANPLAVHDRLPLFPLLPAGIRRTTFALTSALLAACCSMTLAAQETSTTSATAPKADSRGGTLDEEVVILSTFEVNTANDSGYQAANSVDVTRMATAIKDTPMNVTIFNQQFINDLLARETGDLLMFDPAITKTDENDGFMVRGIKNANTNFLNGFPLQSGLGSQPLANIDRVTVMKGPNAVIFGVGGFGGVINRETKVPHMKPATSLRVIASEHGTWRAEVDENIPLGNGKKYLFRVNGVWEDGTASIPWKSPRREIALGSAFTWLVSKQTKLNLEYFFNRQERQAQWGMPIVNGDPNGITVGDGTYLPYGDREISLNDPSDIRRNTVHIVMADLKHSFGPRFEYRAQFLYQKKLTDNTEIQALPEGLIILRDAVLVPRAWGHDDRDYDDYRVRNELSVRFATGPVKHRMIFGGAYSYSLLDFNQDQSSRNFGGITNTTYLNTTNGIIPVGQQRYDGTGIQGVGQAASTVRNYRSIGLSEVMADPRVIGLNPNLILPLNLFDPSRSFAVPDFAHRTPLLLNIRRHTFARNWEGYINDISSFWDDRVFVNIGGRYVKNQQWRGDRVTGAHPTTSLLATPNVVERWDEGIAHNLGAVFHLDRARRFSLYGNVNRSFEPQPQLRTTVEGDLLDPEKGIQRELGLKFDLGSGRFQGLITYFNIRHVNVSGADPVNSGFFIPLAGRETEGFEVGYNFRPTKSWSVFGGYAYTDSKDNPGYKRFIASADRSPRHAVTLFSSWNGLFIRGLSFNLGGVYTGPREIAQTNINATRRVEPYWGPTHATVRVDTTVGYNFRPKKKIWKVSSIQLSLKVSNLLDETDILYYASEYEFRAQPGRGWTIACGTRF